MEWMLCWLWIWSLRPSWRDNGRRIRLLAVACQTVINSHSTDLTPVRRTQNQSIRPRTMAASQPEEDPQRNTIKEYHDRNIGLLHDVVRRPIPTRVKPLHYPNTHLKPRSFLTSKYDKSRRVFLFGARRATRDVHATSWGVSLPLFFSVRHPVGFHRALILVQSASSMSIQHASNS